MTTRSFTITRRFDVPPELVFQAWTDPASLAWFFNPGQPIPDTPPEVDLRVGGAWRQLMIIDADTRYVTGGVYREIVPNERLVFTWGAAGGWPALDLEHGPRATVTFRAVGDQTEMVFTLDVPASLGDLPVREGWTDTLARLVPARAPT